MEVGNALKVYPEDEDFLFLQASLKQEYQFRATTLQQSDMTPREKGYLGRVGKTNKRQYPWMEEALFFRTPELVEEINKTTAFTNCEVRQAHFGPRITATKGNGEDVGPLGVFAKEDIHRDDVVLLDYNVTVVTRIPPSERRHCDACQASLSHYFLDDLDIRVPKCCNSVAYCSEKCLKDAKGYHRILCGKDFSWIYESVTTEDHLDGSWRPSILLRIIAMVLTDIAKSKLKGKAIHPLQHPLLARLTAGYTSASSQAEHEWGYFTHVVAPTKILLQLGIDIFASKEWTPEVLHTIYWREVNNACHSQTLTIPPHPSPDHDPIPEKIFLSGISPHYIFFNHSCDANVSWISAGSAEAVVWLDKKKGMKSKVGNNAMLCVATRDIRKGEEARISYVPENHRHQLSRWFEGGCGCGSCPAGETVGDDETGVDEADADEIS
jgi:hypothetical protein